MATSPLSPYAQGIVDTAMQGAFPSQQNPDPLRESFLPILNERAKQQDTTYSAAPTEDSGFAKQFFGVDSPDEILRAVGPSETDPNKIIYEFAGDGKRYNAPADKTPEQVLEAIWDKKSPGIWGAAKGATLYGMPSELSSALAHTLEGVGMEDLGQEWHQYADSLKADYQKNYGQFMVPGVEAAWEHGKLYDYALQTIGAGAPYMAWGLAGGMGGAALAAKGSARLGAFLGASGVTAPITIAQFADRQVEALKAQGVENPRDHIDWAKAATLGSVASAMQALPIDSILFAGPVLNTLTKWGVDLGTKTSSRLLGNLADVAGTNAMVGLGVSALSRMNADMPLLDDDAKSEYLNAVAAGTLVGIPFGLYKGYRYKAPPKEPTPKIDPDFLNTDDTPISEKTKDMRVAPEDIIYGEAPPEQKLLGPPSKSIIRDPNESYGINDRVDAAAYLDNIKYKDQTGNDTTGLQEFFKTYANSTKTPTDRDLVDAARRAAFVRNREQMLKRTPNGILFETIDDLPQNHSNSEKILTKAAALTDQFGYNDAVVRQFSDAMIEKLYRTNVLRDLEKSGAKYPEQIKQKVLEDFENFVDKKVIEDAANHGGLYKRPDALERINNNIKNTNQLLSENPRKKLAEALMKKRVDDAKAKIDEAAMGPKGPPEVPIRAYDETGLPRFIEEPPMGDEPFGPYAGMRRDPNIRGLLEGPSKERLDYYKYEDDAKAWDQEYVKRVLEKRSDITKKFDDVRQAITKRLDEETVTNKLLRDDLDNANVNNTGSKKQDKARTKYLSDLQKKIKSSDDALQQLRNEIEKTKTEELAEINKITVPEIGPKPKWEGPVPVDYKPVQTAKILNEAANMPGKNASPKLKKTEVIEALLKSPLFERMLSDGSTTTAELRRIANNYWKAKIDDARNFNGIEKGDLVNIEFNGVLANEKPLKVTDLIYDKKNGRFVKVEGSETGIPLDAIKRVTQDAPAALPDGSFRYNPANFKGKPKRAPRVDLSDVSQQYLSQLRDEVAQMAMERNKDFLAKNPDLGPALNQMAKYFAEASANVKVSEKPRILKATKKFSEQVMTRAKLLNTIDNVFTKIHPNISKIFRDGFEKMLSGRQMDKATFNAVLTSLETAFNIDKPNKLSTEGLSNWYKNMRSFLPDKTIEALDKNRKFFVEWYGNQEGINPNDLARFKTEDIEGLAFANYLKGDLNVNVKEFKELRQKKIFNAYEKAFRQLGKELNDSGHKRLSDILEYNDDPTLFEQNSKEVPPEARRPSAMASRIVEEANRPSEETAKKAVEEMNDEAAESSFNAPPPKFRGPQTKSGGNSNDPFLRSEHNNMGDTAGFWSFIFSIPKMARKYPLIGRVHNIFVRQKDVAAQVDLAFTKQFEHVYKDLANKDWDKINKGHDVLDHLRNTKQLIETDTQGRVVFKDEQNNDVVLSKNDSDIVKGVADFYKIGIRQDLQVTRELLENFREEYNIGKDSSLDNIKASLDNMDKLVEGNPLPEFRNKYMRDRDVLQSFYDQIAHSESMLDRKTAYVPHMRMGDYTVWVKDRKTGELVWMQAIDNTDNMFGFKTSGLPSQKFVDQKIDTMGLRKKFDPSKYEITHGQLTYNNAGKLIQKGMLSMELIQSLNATGLERNISLAQQLGTGIQDPVGFMRAWSEDAGATKNHIMKYILAQGKGKYLIRAQDEPIIGGYDRNWDNIMDAYKNTYKNSVARKSTSLELAQAQKDITLGDKISPKLRDYTNNYINFILDPSTDYGALRNFNFMWTMGYRASTGILQAATIPTQSASIIVGYTMNPLRAMSYLSKGIKLNHQMAPKDKNFFESHPGYFRQSMTEDALAKEINTDFISHMGPLAKNTEKFFNLVKNNAGIFVSTVENFTRKSTFLSYRSMFEENPDITRRAMKDLKDDYDWQYFWKHNENIMNVEDALSVYHMLKAHGEFGKIGRGPMQRGLFGSMAFPFMTYPQQMMETLFDQLVGRRGGAGVAAGLYTMTAYVALSGLSGIPAYELWKTLYEEYEKRVNGRTIDLNMQLEAGGIPEVFRRGLLSSMSGLDISQRLGQDIIGQNLLIGLLKDDIKIGEVTGVPGRAFTEMFAGAGAALSNSGNKSPMEIAMPFLPAGAKDILKTAQMVTEPEAYWKTKSGKMLRDIDENPEPNIAELGGQLLGFTPLEKTKARERQFMQQRANQEFTGWKSRLAESIASAEYKMHLGLRLGDNEQYNEGREMRKEVTKELREYAKANGIKLNADFWRGLRTSVQNRLYQKKNPGKIRKPTQQERKYLDIIEE